MAAVSSRLEDALKADDDALDALFAKLDRDVEASREVFREHGRVFAAAEPERVDADGVVEPRRWHARAPDAAVAAAADADADAAAADAIPSVSADDWAAAEAAAVVRGVAECPICLAALAGAAGAQRREVVLLSCSHVFHAACVQAFESFHVYATPHCAMCRQPYRKRRVGYYEAGGDAGAAAPTVTHGAPHAAAHEGDGDGGVRSPRAAAPLAEHGT